MVAGRDIRRWNVEYKDKFLIVTKIGVEIKKYPAIFAHLKQWQPQLEKRSDQGNHWWELRACAYYDAFDKPKIIYPQIMAGAMFAFDNTGMMTNQKCFIIQSHSKYLLGVLNSLSFWNIIVEGSPILRGGYSEPRRDYLKKIPIPTPSVADRAAIETLVEACLKKRGANCADEEAEINARVAKLYGL